MSKEQNEATQKNLAEAINGGDLDAMDDLFAGDVVDHDPAPEQGPGPDGFKEFFATMRSAFPDLRIAPEQMVVDDENVAVAYTLSGTHEGEFQGIAPTGRKFDVRGMQIARFEDGKIAERWGSSDELGILKTAGRRARGGLMPGSHLTPLGAVGRGLLAGVAGTAAMTAWQELSAKLQSSDGEGGGSEEKPKDPWEEASAPAKVGRRIIEGVFRKEVPAEQIGTLTNVMHWGYGTTWGAVYGLIAGSRRSTLGGGLAFGLAVWASSYAQLVPMGIYQPPWTYEPEELALDVSYHLVYGGATALAFAVVSR